MSSTVGATRRAPRLGEAFEAIYTEHFPFVWRTLLHLGVPRGVAEDAAQEVFIVVHRRLGTWDPEVSLRSWLYGICRRVASGQRRSHHRHRRKLAALPRPEDAPPPDQRVASRRGLARLHRALERLDPDTREAFLMAELEGMSFREISEATGTNPNTIYSRVRKARAAARACLASADEESTT